VHRVGPHRLNVRLARKLAGLGLTCWRLDLSGIGDSRPIPGLLTFRESAVHDIHVAMDHAGNDLGLQHFTLVGLCSGADNALAAAEQDPRIDELVLMDAPAYATPQSRRRQRLARVPRIRTAADVPRWALGMLRALIGSIIPRAAGRRAIPEKESARKLPQPAEFERMLLQLAGRGVRILLVYSGVLGERYNSKNQLFEAFPAMAGRVEVKYFADANHVFTELEQRSSLVDTIVTWMHSRIGAR
ncbi:MAG: alpha/beta fold hydrolase, partial [Steroidobacteraceae bacterium]